ncbi:MAG: protein-glutamate O-methyltransferase CheR, partial [Desulfobacterales bacterium]|nr:protein-glutamate O-methyltransferase CheR [Desulfobacterales bacterium]
YKKNRTKLDLNTLKIWSAGCSSGEEAYSIAISVSEATCSDTDFKIKILASDLSTKMLSMAMDGVYPKNNVSNIPENILKKYFQKGRGACNDYVRIKSSLKQIIEFRHLNLMELFQFNDKFNIIFCRNVMIYFDKIAQEKLVSKLYDALYDKGYLFIGHSESLMGIKHKFKYTRPTIYLKNP